MAALDLCVYGTPHGFSSYEVPVALGEYCERFYRTNRRGKMLMVNRRHDGTTIYSFLVYDLIEADKRPHAYFGTSFTLHGNQYIPNLKNLYQLFDCEFKALVATGRLFEPVGDRYKYIVGNFNAVGDALNNYLQHLLNGLRNFETESFTADFFGNNSGQIILKNINTSIPELTAAFKKCQWMAISPYFKPDEPAIEIDLGDILQQYTESLESLSQMSIYSHFFNSERLNVIISQARSSSELLKKYASQTGIDNEELRKIDDLSKKLNTLQSNANVLRSQRATTNTEQPITQSPNTTTQTTTTDQSQNNSIGTKTNEDSSNEPKPLKSTKSPFHVDPVLCGILAIIICIVLISCFLIFGRYGEDRIVAENPLSDTTEIKYDFGFYLKQEDFENALTVADAEQRTITLPDKFAKTIMARVEQEPERAIEILREFDSKYPNTAKLCSNVIGVLNQTATELNEIYTSLNKPDISKAAKKALKTKIAKLDASDELKKALTTKVDALRSENTAAPGTQPIPPTVENNSPTNITLYTTKDDYKTTQKKESLSPDKLDIKLKNSTEYILQADCPIKITKNTFRIFNRITETEVRIHSISSASGELTIGDKTYKVSILK